MASHLIWQRSLAWDVQQTRAMSLKGEKGMFQKLRKLTKSERGSTAVEFALLLPIIATLTFGMIDFGRMLWFQEVLVNATRTGARQGTLFNSGNGSSEIQGFVAQSLTNGGVPPAGLNVTVTGLGTGQRESAHGDILYPVAIYGDR